LGNNTEPVTFCFTKKMNTNSIESEFGGEFHWMGISSEPCLSWPQPCSWTGLGRNSVVSLYNERKKKYKKTNLWLPTYFCGEVIDSWQKAGIPIQPYIDDPCRKSPDFSSLCPHKGDMVLALNYFGFRRGLEWKDWYSRFPESILIEDHTHDPFSRWANNSQAAYAFASVRKIFPAPDGAVLWSPQKRVLPEMRSLQDWQGSGLKLSAMILKKEYLDSENGNPVLKENFRRFQIEGERMLVKNSYSSISPWSSFVLSMGYPRIWRSMRRKNVALLYDLASGIQTIRPLQREWDSSSCPFNAVFICESERFRDTLRSQLIARNIYAVVHWPLSTWSGTHAIKISKTILTIPVDQRYSEKGIRFIAATLRSITKKI
jgi:hypothetical protein